MYTWNMACLYNMYLNMTERSVDPRPSHFNINFHVKIGSFSRFRLRLDRFQSLNAVLLVHSLWYYFAAMSKSDECGESSLNLATIKAANSKNHNNDKMMELLRISKQTQRTEKICLSWLLSRNWNLVLSLLSLGCSLLIPWHTFKPNW